MDSYTAGWFILVLVLTVTMGLGYVAGQANPPKGEIILTTFGPHGCKGMPKARHWHEGTQWQCAECKDVWEVYRAYDGIESTLEWKRLDKKPATKIK